MSGCFRSRALRRNQLRPDLPGQGTAGCCSSSAATPSSSFLYRDISTPQSPSDWSTGSGSIGSRLGGRLGRANRLAVAFRIHGHHRAVILADTCGWRDDTLRAKLELGVFSGTSGPGRTIRHQALQRLRASRAPEWAQAPEGHGPGLARYLGPFSDPPSRIPCSVLPRESIHAVKFPIAFGSRELAQWQRLLLASAHAHPSTAPATSVPPR